MNFVLVNYFDPQYGVYAFNHRPFWINLDHVNMIRCYDENIDAAVNYDPVTKAHHKIIPEGALDTIYVNMVNKPCGYQLDVESSQKVMKAINKETK